MAGEKTPPWVLNDKIVVTPPPAPEPSVADTLGQWAGVTARALAPYAAAAGVGAAAGAPFAGVGAVPGAAAGVTALGLGDIGTGLYNLAAPAWGGYRIPLPSETIQSGGESIGIWRRPETPAQQVYSDVLQAGAGGLSQSLAAARLAPRMTTPAGRNIMQFLAQQPRAQTVASMGGAAVPSVAANYFGVTDPTTLMGLSLAGGMAGGKLATPKAAIPTVENLKSQATAAYQRAEQAGVRVAQPALSQLNTDVRARLAGVQYDPGTQPQVRKWVNILDRNFQGPVSFQKLDALHSDIMAEARTVQNDRTRMMLTRIGETLDDFLTNIQPGQTTAGNAATATTALAEARGLWRSKSQLSTLDDATTAARNRAEQAGIGFGDSLRREYRKILNNKRAFARFSPDVQDAIRNVANGTPTSRTLDVIGRLSPTNRSAIASELMAGGGLFWATQHTPTSLLIPGAMAAAGGTAKVAANRMAISQAERARAAAAGVPPIYSGPLAAPVAQQILQARQRGQTAQQRRDIYEPPSWVLPAQNR